MRDRKPLPAAAPHKRPAKPTIQTLEAEAALFPEASASVMTEGVRRLVAYQNADYARLYLDRLRPFSNLDLLPAVARHLAVRMSFEDVIRVAEAKIAPARLAASRARLAPRTSRTSSRSS